MHFVLAISLQRCPLCKTKGTLQNHGALHDLWGPVGMGRDKTKHLMHLDCSKCMKTFPNEPASEPVVNKRLVVKDD
jgi:hypothetical protein